MSRFIYDTIFILLPKQAPPEEAIDEAVTIANLDAEIKIVNRPSLLEVQKEVFGSFWTSGLIPSRPKEELVARVGVAWFTDSIGRKHVRIVSDLKKVKFHESNVLWPQSLPCHNLVYATSVEQNGLRITCKCGKTGLLVEMQWDGHKCWVCQENERYERETGFQPYVRIPRRKN